MEGTTPSRPKAGFRLGVALWFLLVPTLACAAQPSSTQAVLAQNGPATEIFIATNATQVSIPAATHGLIRLEGPWAFHKGDDPSWAGNNVDDSNWDKVTLGIPFAEQGIDTYSGYAWYRIRIQLQPNSKAAETQLALLVTPFNVGQLQVFANGVEVGRTRGMTDHPKEFLSGPFICRLPPPRPDGTVLIAIRSWVGGDIVHGLIDRVAVGGPDHIAESFSLAQARHWDQRILAGLMISFLFFCVAILGATLYFSQRHHGEYLWMALLCLSVTIAHTVEFIYHMALMPLAVFLILNLWTSRLFMIVTLEFVLRFTGSSQRRFVRILQISFLLLPVISLIHFEKLYDVLSVTAEIVFCSLVAVMLFRAWRRGLTEAGVMLFPFFIASIADSIDTILDYFAERRWLGLSESFSNHTFSFGPIEYSTRILTYGVFLGSLVAVIIYRFIRVSEIEQRSSAEIDAARSVQALLIPTQLPSNRNFLLESAYLPASGVGGDFFQVLPLKDDSMLIVVGDVSGKGLQAAMSASTLVGALRNELSNDPATILAHLNQVMLGNVSAPPGRSATNAVAGFATCLCARIYPDGKMTIANAGHLSPYRDGRELELSPCLPLGVIPNVEYEQAILQLRHGDRLIFLSDGVVEATDPKGELFGFERTQQVSHESPRYIAQTAQRFGQTDDITVVGLYFVPA